MCGIMQIYTRAHTVVRVPYQGDIGGEYLAMGPISLLRCDILVSLKV